MSKANLTVIYGGPALADGTMNVKYLAPALLALGSLIEKSHKEINEDKKGLSVLIKSDFKKGSFEIDIFVLWKTAKDFFGLSDYRTVKELLGILVIGRKSVFTIVKWLKKRNFSAKELKDGNIRIQTEDGEAKDISPEVYRLLKDKEARRLMSESVRPLEHNGITDFETRQDRETGFKMNKEDLPSFLTKEKTKIVNEYRKNMRLQIDNLPLTNPETRWRFTEIEPDSKDAKPIEFSAAVTDQEYLNGVNNGEHTFKSGARILATVLTREIQRADDEDTIIERTVEKVLEHDTNHLKISPSPDLFRYPPP